MTEEQYRYTYQYNLLGVDSEEECFINKSEFWPNGEVTEGSKLRGEFGFMEIIQVFDEPSIRYGKFIAKSIAYEEMQQHVKGLRGE